MAIRSTVVLALLIGLANSSHAAGVAPDEIHELVAQGSAEAVRALLAAEPTLLDARDELGRAPLLVAAVGENVEIARLLLTMGADVDPRDDRQRTPLWHAARENDGLEVASLLLANGADVNAVGFLNAPPVESALHNRNDAMVELLLDNGAALPTETGPRFRLMWIAAETSSERIFDRMFELLPTLDPAGEDAIGFLRAAAGGGSAAILNRLLATGINPDSPDVYGFLPIHMTSRSGFVEATLALIAGGADADSRTATGDSPYNLALANGHSDLAQRLVQAGADASPPSPPLLQGDYLGEQLPGSEPATFAPGIVSRAGSENIHSTTVFSRDGSEVYWSDSWAAPISFMKRIDGRWTMPAHVPFTTGNIDDLPMFSPDERRLYFLSSTPIGDGDPTRQEFLWYVERESRDDEWSEPIPGPAAINAVPLHWQFAIAPNGDFYIPTTTANSLGARDIHISRLADGEYQAVEPLGAQVNTAGDEHMPFIAPDDSYMVFAARDRPGTSDTFLLYISFRDSGGNFAEPIALPEAINGNGHRICPVITPDGKYLFYLAGTEVHWVSTDFVETLRE